MIGKYLIQERPLIALPTLAVKLGINEAIILQQIHFWSLISKVEAGDARWVDETYSQLQREFPWLSLWGIRKIIRKLEKSGIIVSIVKENEYGKVVSKYYTVDRDKLNNFKGGTLDHPSKEGE